MMTLETATRLLKAAEEEAAEQGLRMAFAVVDPAGHPVAIHRMDGAGFFTPRIALSKAWTAVAFRAPTADLGERLASAPFFVQAMTSMTDGSFVAGGGGLPVEDDSGIIGGIGASGGTAAQDSDVVRAAIQAVI